MRAVILRGNGKGYLAEVLETNPHKGTWKKGERAWFEYHCYEGEDSADAPAWHHTHQRVTIISEGEADETAEGLTFRQRAAQGVPKTYRVRFDDGLEWDAFEDELTTTPKDFYRPSYEPVRGNPQVRENPGFPVVPEAEMEHFTGDFIRTTWREINAEAKREGWDHRGTHERLYGYVDGEARRTREHAKFAPAWVVAGTVLYKIFYNQPFNDCNKRTGYNLASQIMNWSGYQRQITMEEALRYLNSMKKRYDEITAEEVVSWVKKTFGA